MIKVVTAAERHTSNREWIHSEFSFSFADYDDPSNAHFGALLAHNDNELKPEQGMHEHPHHNLEIITYVVSGVLKHQDDLGNHADLQAGSVQLMSAGTGINHSETNPSDHVDVRFLQIWLLPDRPGKTPKWDARFFPAELKLNHLLPVASGEGLRARCSWTMMLTSTCPFCRRTGSCAIPSRRSGEPICMSFPGIWRSHARTVYSSSSRGMRRVSARAVSLRSKA